MKKIIAIGLIFCLFLFTPVSVSYDENININPDEKFRLIQNNYKINNWEKNHGYYFNSSYAQLDYRAGLGIEIGCKGKGFEVADIDDDGNEEIVFSSLTSSYPADEKYSINIAKYENGCYNIYQKIEFDLVLTCFDIADVDNDLELEIVIGFQNNEVIILNAETFDTEWTCDDFNDVINDIDCSDVDLDDDVEIIISVGSELVIINGISHIVEWQSENLGLPGSVVVVEDVDNDLQKEILLGTCDWIAGQVYVFDGISPDVLEWESPVFDDLVSSIWVSDTDGDEEPEILIGSCDLYEGYIDAGVHVFSSDTFILEWEKPNSYAGSYCVAISEDIDHDDTPEIIITETDLPDINSGSYLYVYDGNTYQLEDMEIYHGEWRYGPGSLCCNDIDDDGDYEIIFGKARGSLHIKDGTNLDDEWQSFYTGRQHLKFESADVDNDECIEIIGCMSEGSIYVLDGSTFSEEWRSDVMIPNPLDSLKQLDVYDVDCDNDIEILVGFENRLIILNGVTHEVEKIHNTYNDLLLCFDAFDIDGDTDVEILIGSMYGYIYIYDAITFDLEWQSADLGFGVTAINCDDIDCDGICEIVASVGQINNDDFVYVFNGLTHAVEWQSVDYRQAIQIITLSDIDNDNAIEILFSLRNGKVYVVDGQTFNNEWISEDLGVDVHGLQGGDIDYDGKKEIIIGSEQGLFVYNGSSYEEKWSNDSFGFGDICCVDIDGDKATEIFGGFCGFFNVFEVKKNDGPVISILKPTNALYILNRSIIPLRSTVIIGAIQIEVDVYDNDSDIERVEYFLDDELINTSYNEPYSWMWKKRVFLRHILKVVVYDISGNSAFQQIQVYKFF